MTKPTQLTKEHLAAYLPYGLEVSIDWKLAGLNGFTTLQKTALIGRFYMR